jgi:hypothetical protein
MLHHEQITRDAFPAAGVAAVKLDHYMRVPD